MLISIFKVDTYLFLVSVSFCIIFPISILCMIFFVETNDQTNDSIENSIVDVREIVTQLDEITGSVKTLVSENIDTHYV